ncbi:hypothetical protein H4R34_001146, partial [Dimargaris verticillata]
MPSSTPSAPLVPSALKVADLRKALSSRGYPTKGLKKELIERLEEVLAKEQSGTANQTKTPPASASPSLPSPKTLPEPTPAAQAKPDPTQALSPAAALVALATQACSTSHTVVAPVATGQPNQAPGSKTASTHGPTSTPSDIQPILIESPQASPQTDIPDSVEMQADVEHIQAIRLPPVSNYTKTEPVLAEVPQSLDIGQQEPVAGPTIDTQTATPSPKHSLPVVKGHSDRKRPASPLEKGESSPKRLCDHKESPITVVPAERRDSEEPAP